MEDSPKYEPFWFDLDESALQCLSREATDDDEGLLQPQDDDLCKQCRDIRLNELFSGTRFPSDAFSEDSQKPISHDLKQYTPRCEADLFRHIRSVGAVRAIAGRKSCALCRVLSAVHESAHPGCAGNNEQCLLLPMSADCGISVKSGKLDIEDGLVSMYSGETESHNYATHVHVLFQSRPLKATKLGDKPDSHFRDEAERWIFRLDTRDVVDERLCYNHVAGTSNSINWANLKTWLSLCTSKISVYAHERCHNSEIHLCRFLETCTHGVDKHERFLDGPPFRCIDVEAEKLLELDMKEHYVALSYVWGAVKVSRQDVLNDDRIRTDKLPRVIRDAMVATQKLEERYLWVDLICIDQSDPEDVQRQIERMDLIYRLADVTLVATVAEDANCVLPGVTSDRPIQEHMLRINGARIYCSLQESHGSVIASSTWNKRGWTFQERVLTPRCLHFLESEVVFQCRQCSGYELLDASGALSLKVRPEINATWASDDITLGWNFFNYEELVHRFSSRQLTYESDVMNAFLGIEAWLRDRYGRKFIFGLPVDDILSSLTWTLEDGVDTSSRRCLFPSWTWADWRGHIEYRHYVNFHRGEVPVVGPSSVPSGFSYPNVNIVQQAHIRVDHSESPVRKLIVDTELRQFRLVQGPPETTLDEAKEIEIHKFAGDDLAEIAAGRDLFYMLGNKPRPEKFEQHFVDQQGKLVLPQSPETNFLSRGDIVYQEVRLGSQFDSEMQMCTLLLLAHVTDPDEEEDDLEDGQSAHSQEVTKEPRFDHVFSMLVRGMEDATFERVALFTWRAEDWFRAEQVLVDRPVILV